MLGFKNNNKSRGADKGEKSGKKQMAASVAIN